MIKFNDIKIGDYLMGEFEGEMWEGEVVRLNNEDKQVCLETDVQEFWFEPERLHPIPLTDEALQKLSFEREEMEDGKIKYKKASFRLVVPAKDDFSGIDIWYREDRRHHPDIHYVHQLQNAHLQMTKVHLTREPV
jgi:hypothetical protein